MTEPKDNLFRLIEIGAENRASDLHLRSDEPPSFRIKTELRSLKGKVLTREDILEFAAIVMKKPSANDQSILNANEADGSYTFPNICRVRYNFFRFHEKIGLVLRLIPLNVPTVKQLKLPPLIAHVSESLRGLILVTGMTGSGKSTTLAAMIDHINETRRAHIITLEDPIEYLHQQKKSRISQRELGRDTKDFHTAMRSALRQNPDVIMLGEMRDPESLQVALQAAETGHLVLSTMHTRDALGTVGRVISMFPPEEQQEVRQRLALSLRATVSQRMLKKKDGEGVIPALELMLNSPGIQDAISGKDPIERINQVIGESYKNRDAKLQGRLFDQDLIHLFESDIIDKETALKAASSGSDLLQRIHYE